MLAAPSRLLATREPAFLGDVTGVYRLPRSTRIVGALVIVVMFGLIAVVVIVRLSSVGAAFMLALSVVAAVDGATTTMTVSDRGVERRSALRVFDAFVPLSDVRRVQLLARGSHLLLRIEHGVIGKQTIAVEGDERDRILRAAGVADPQPAITPAASVAQAIVSAVAAGAMIGWTSAILAGIVYGEVSRAAGVVIACAAVALTVVVNDLMLRGTRPIASRRLRAITGAIALLVSAAVLSITIASLFAR